MTSAGWCSTTICYSIFVIPTLFIAFTTAHKESNKRTKCTEYDKSNNCTDNATATFCYTISTWNSIIFTGENTYWNDSNTAGDKIVCITIALNTYGSRRTTSTSALIVSIALSTPRKSIVVYIPVSYRMSYNKWNVSSIWHWHITWIIVAWISNWFVICGLGIRCCRIWCWLINYSCYWCFIVWCWRNIVWYWSFVDSGCSGGSSQVSIFRIGDRA